MKTLADVIRDYIADEPDVDFVRFQTVRDGLEMEVTYKDGSVGYWTNRGHQIGWELCTQHVPSLTE